MVRSLRVRIQIWYAIVLLAVVSGFGGVLYYQVRADRMQRIEARLEAAARFLEASLRAQSPPPRDVNGPGARGFGGPPGTQEGPGPREMQRGGRGPNRGMEDRRPADERRGPDDRHADDRRPQNERRGPLDSGPPQARLPEPLELPASLLDRPDDAPQDLLYYAVWRPDHTLLAASDALPPQPPDNLSQARAGRVEFRWRPNEHREASLMLPRGLVIVVGKSVARDMAELRWLAWRTIGSGLLVLAVGLIGGWIVARGITRPIDAIAATAASISAKDLARRIDTYHIDQELVGLARVLNEMFARLEEAFTRQSRFTADASHELRTPLAILQSHVELALTRPRSGDDYRETLSACLRASSRMAALVDGLLTLARADAGRLDPQFRPVDLRQVVADVVEQFRPQADEHQVALSAALGEGALVDGDAAFLARIPSNLLSNAMRHTPAGGQVRVMLRADMEQVCLIVEDNGSGIPSEDQPRVFERFFRADKARSRASGGNGLGLAICKSLVEAHRGAIGFRSTPGRGTRFEVRIPTGAAKN